MVGWTRTAFVNCLISPEYIVDEARFKRFVDEIELKSNNAIDVEVIDWIWDEIEAISKYGPRYSANWRPTNPERLRDAARSTSGEPIF